MRIYSANRREGKGKEGSEERGGGTADNNLETYPSSSSESFKMFSTFIKTMHLELVIDATRNFLLFPPFQLLPSYLTYTSDTAPQPLCEVFTSYRYRILLFINVGWQK